MPMLTLLESLQAATAPTDAWGQLLAGGTAAGLVAALFVFVLRHTTASHEKTMATLAEAMKHSAGKHEEAASAFATALREAAASHASATATFAEAVAQQQRLCEESKAAIVREMRAAADAREARILETFHRP